MKIIDGFSEFLQKKKLSEIISKISGLSGYKRYIFDSLFKTEEENDAFNKTLDDDRLASTALMYLFLHDKGTLYRGLKDLLPDAFKDLTYSQQCKFLRYYRALKSDAIKYGFLVKYEEINDRLKTKFSGIIAYIPFVLGSLLFLYAANSIIVLVVILIVGAYLDVQRGEESLSMKTQNDFIIRKLNQEKIASIYKSSQMELIDLEWLEKE
jgi:hypothetical protein